ncbi:hypothetical protein A0126_05465 [Exiguobacterium sp. N4-1P]|nr:hypothetical protein A0126_05465 [Exiguobacterium sp. N4-1P]
MLFRPSCSRFEDETRQESATRKHIGINLSLEFIYSLERLNLFRAFFVRIQLMDAYIFVILLIF